MSLLMDALKKAEREREAQASKERGDKIDSPQELSLDPIELTPEPEPPVLEAEDSHWDILGDSGEISNGFELNLTDSNLSAEPRPEATPALASARELEMGFSPDDPRARSDIPLSLDGTDDLAIEDTAGTMPSMKAVQASVDRYFDGGQSASSVSMQIPLEQDDATTVVRRRATDEAAQVVAQTVFAAKAPKGPSRNKPIDWGLASGVAFKP